MEETQTVHSVAWRCGVVPAPTSHPKTPQAVEGEAKERQMVLDQMIRITIKWDNNLLDNIKWDNNLLDNIST